MKITFDQTKEDIADLTNNSFGTNKIIIIVIAIIVVLALLNAGQSFSIEGLLASLIPIIIIGVIWFFIMKIVRDRALGNPKSKDLLFGHRTIELNEDTVTVISNVSKTVYKWTAFSKFTQSPKSYFLYLGTNQAIIIPKRAFLSSEEHRLFEQIVQQNLKN